MAFLGSILNVLKVKDKLAKKQAGATAAPEVPTTPTTATQDLMQPVKDPAQPQQKKRKPAGAAFQTLTGAGGLL